MIRRFPIFQETASIEFYRMGTTRQSFRRIPPVSRISKLSSSMRFTDLPSSSSNRNAPLSRLTGADHDFSVVIVVYSTTVRNRPSPDCTGYWAVISSSAGGLSERNNLAPIGTRGGVFDRRGLAALDVSNG